MKYIEKDWGKITLTVEGLWNKSKSYERITMVHDGAYSSFISIKDVPVGIMLGNSEYWMPVASLKEDFKIELITVRKEIIDLIAEVTYKMRTSRLVVRNTFERKSLTYLQIAPGCEVYELDTKLTYILDSIIPDNNAKAWHLKQDGLINSEFKYKISDNDNKELNIHQLNKLDIKTNKSNDIYPITITDAIIDVNTGKSLTDILNEKSNKILNRSIPLQGNEYEQTELIKSIINDWFNNEGISIIETKIVDMINKLLLSN